MYQQLEPPIKFSKSGGETQLLEGVAWKEGGDFFRGGGVCNFHKKKKKSEIFNV